KTSREFGQCLHRSYLPETVLRCCSCSRTDSDAERKAWNHCQTRRRLLPGSSPSFLPHKPDNAVQYYPHKVCADLMDREAALARDSAVRLCYLEPADGGRNCRSKY